LAPMDTLLMGVVLGLFAGMIPGAFSTVVVTTALERGLGPGIRVALIPILTELPVMLASVLVLARMPEGALRWVGMVGGTVLLVIAWKVARGANSADMHAAVRRRNMGHYTRVFLFGILSPSPWAFWFLLGGPLFLNRWNVGPIHGIGFLVTFMGCFLGVMILLAWAVATGRRQLNPTWYRRILQGAGAVLVVAGIVLIWQSWAGNFAALVQAPEHLDNHLPR
jgi:threonine/homoserine/homoserine lactone efflux protein